MKKLSFLLIGFIAGLIPTAFAATVFTDVEESSWYYEAVQSLSEKDIIKGYEDGSFKPSDNVNRAELAVTLDRLIDYLEPAEHEYTLSKIQVGADLPSDSDSFSFTSDTYTNYYFLDGDILYLSPGYGGGCENHSFEMIWDGSFTDSEHSNLYLIHDEQGETCKNYETQNLKFDLSTIRLAYETEFAVTEGDLQLRIYNKAEDGNSITVNYSF